MSSHDGFEEAGLSVEIFWFCGVVAQSKAGQQNEVPLSRKINETQFYLLSHNAFHLFCDPHGNFKACGASVLPADKLLLAFGSVSKYLEPLTVYSNHLPHGTMRLSLDVISTTSNTTIPYSVGLTPLSVSGLRSNVVRTRLSISNCLVCP